MDSRNQQQVMFHACMLMYLTKIKDSELIILFCVCVFVCITFNLHVCIGLSCVAPSSLSSRPPPSGAHIPLAVSAFPTPPRRIGSADSLPAR